MKEKIYKVLFFASLVLYGVYLIMGDSLEIMGFGHLFVSLVSFALLFFFFLKWRTNINEDEKKLKQAAKVLAGDFDEKHKDDIFFINHNYNESYTQSEWAKLYKKLKAENNPQALVPMYNAVVVNSEGYFRRKGLYEAGSGSFMVFDSEFYGDKIGSGYAIEPYTYCKRSLRECDEITKALREKFPSWNHAVEKELSKASASSNRSSGSCAPSYPKSGYSAPARKGLSAYQRAELNSAKTSYLKAVDERKRHPESDRIYESLEKKAYTHYMHVLTKYAGRE